MMTMGQQQMYQPQRQIDRNSEMTILNSFQNALNSLQYQNTWGNFTPQIISAVVQMINQNRSHVNNTIINTVMDSMANINQPNRIPNDQTMMQIAMNVCNTVYSRIAQNHNMQVQNMQQSNQISDYYGSNAIGANAQQRQNNNAMWNRQNNNVQQPMQQQTQPLFNPTGVTTTTKGEYDLFGNPINDDNNTQAPSAVNNQSVEEVNDTTIDGEKQKLIAKMKSVLSDKRRIEFTHTSLKPEDANVKFKHNDVMSIVSIASDTSDDGDTARNVDLSAKGMYVPRKLDNIVSYMRQCVVLDAPGESFVDLNSTMLTSTSRVLQRAEKIKLSEIVQARTQLRNINDPGAVIAALSNDRRDGMKYYKEKICALFGEYIEGFVLPIKSVLRGDKSEITTDNIDQVMIDIFETKTGEWFDEYMEFYQSSDTLIGAYTKGLTRAIEHVLSVDYFSVDSNTAKYAPMISGVDFITPSHLTVDDSNIFVAKRDDVTSLINEYERAFSEYIVPIEKYNIVCVGMRKLMDDGAITIDGSKIIGNRNTPIGSILSRYIRRNPFNTYVVPHIEGKGCCGMAKACSTPDGFFCLDLTTQPMLA